MELTLTNIENISEKHQDFSQELQLLYDAVNDYPISGLHSVADLMRNLENEDLKSFDVKEILKFQKSLSVSENAWLIESLESIIAFCNKLEEDHFAKAVSKFKQKLLIG